MVLQAQDVLLVKGNSCISKRMEGMLPTGYGVSIPLLILQGNHPVPCQLPGLEEEVEEEEAGEEGGEGGERTF